MIEQAERTRFPEQRRDLEPKFDAILVHGYWMSEPKSGDVRLALRNRLAVRAAALAYDEGRGAGHIVLPLGKMWGENYESTGNLMADELEFKYGVPPQAIVREGNAYSTGGEVKTFLDIAQKNGWTKLLDIAFSKHFLSISDIFKIYPKQKEKTVQFKSVERIIEQSDEPHVNRLINRISNSRYEYAFKAYEIGKWALTHLFSVNYSTLEANNKKTRIKKGKDFIIPIDIYKL